MGASHAPRLADPMGCLMEEFNRRHFSSIPTSEDEPGGLPRHQKAQSRGKVALGSSLILSFQRFHLPFSQPASAAIKSPQRRLMSRAIPSLLRPGGVARFPLPPPHLTRSRATSLVGIRRSPSFPPFLASPQELFHHPLAFH